MMTCDNGFMTSLPLVFTAPKKGLPPTHFADLDADPDDLHRQLAWLPQQPVVVPGTIAD